MATKTLYRSCDNKVLGGVAAGVAEYYDFDPSLTRLIFALVILTTGFGFLAYVAAWLLIPQDPKCKNGATGADEIKAQADRVASDIKNAAKGIQVENNDVAAWVGVLILLLGTLLLVRTILGVSIARFIWPVGIILIGAVILANSLKKK